MEKLITATGKEFLSDYLATIPFPAQAYIRILGTPIVTVANVFGDPAETSHLQCGEVAINGYTHLLAIIPEADAVKVALGKE